MSHRHQSSIANLRFFHNWIKRSIIIDAADYLRKNYGITNIKLLDLAVGKGGDMRKWYDARIYDVNGIDIDNQSINEKNGAKDRYREFQHQNRGRPLNYSFDVLDLSDPANIPKLDAIIGTKKFNIISCQFAIHYFFRDPDALNTFMNIATRYMASNAIFIGTTMDGEKIQKLFKDNGDTITKDLYSFQNMSKPNGVYGNTFTVSLGKKEKEDHYFSEKPSIEYMVNFDELQKLAQKYNLIFAGKESFDKWYNDYPKRGTLSNQEKEFSFLNFSFAFKKSI